MLFRRIERLLLRGHSLGKHARQEPQSLVRRLIPVRHRCIRPGFPCVFAGLIPLGGLPVHRVQGFQGGRFQPEMLTELGADDHIRRHHVLVIEIIGHKLPRSLHVTEHLAGHGNGVQEVQQNVRGQRLIAPRGRRPDRALSPCKPRAPEPLFADGFAGDGVCTGFQKVVDLLLCARLAVSRIRSGQVVYHLRAALKGSQVRDHGVPVMLRQGRRVLPAVLQEQAGTEYRIEPFLRPALALYGSKVHLRQDIRELILCVFAFRMEADAGHLHRRVLLAVQETGQTHDPRLVHAHRITVKTLHELRLYPAEALHLRGRIHEPVHMVGLLCSHDHGRR